LQYIINPETIEKWPLEKHVGVVSKLLADGKNMTVLWSRWEPNASAPEHIHPHEQIGICLEGEMIFTIQGKDYTVHAGEYYHIPPSTPHAERNDSQQAAILTDFFAPVRSDLLQRHFEPEITAGNITGKGSPKKGGER
jgi:unsaturated pyranuronate lyase